MLKHPGNRKSPLDSLEAWYNCWNVQCQPDGFQHPHPAHLLFVTLKICLSGNRLQRMSLGHRCHYYLGLPFGNPTLSSPFLQRIICKQSSATLSCWVPGQEAQTTASVILCWDSKCYGLIVGNRIIWLILNLLLLFTNSFKALSTLSISWAKGKKKNGGFTI